MTRATLKEIAEFHRLAADVFRSGDKPDPKSLEDASIHEKWSNELRELDEAFETLAPLTNQPTEIVNRKSLNLKSA